MVAERGHQNFKNLYQRGTRGDINIKKPLSRLKFQNRELKY